MKFPGKLFRGKRKEVKLDEKVNETIPEPIEEDVLNLGWYWSERKKRVSDGKD